MKRPIFIPEVPGAVHVENEPVVKILNTEKRGGEVSYSTRVDGGFIRNLINLQNPKIVSLEVDPATNIMIVVFKEGEE